MCGALQFYGFYITQINILKNSCHFYITLKYDLIKQYGHNTPLSVSIHLSIIDGNEFYDSH